MDKSKQPQGPRPRVKRVLPPPGDFIALGKSTSSAKPRSTECDSKVSQAIPRKPSTTSLSAVGQKRKDTSVGNPGVPNKQTRTFSPSFTRKDGMPSKSLDSSESIPTVKLVDAQPSELEELVLAAHAKGDQDQVDGLLCGAMKTLKINRLKPDQMLYLTLLNLAKEKPVLFTTKRVLEHFLQFLRRDTSGSVVKPKPNTLLCILTCNILVHAFQNEENWPQSFMKVYIEDSLGDRSWVDNEHNKEFVSNIICVFGTKLPSNTTSLSSTSKGGLLDSASGSTNLPGTGAKLREGKVAEIDISLEATEQAGVQNRFPLHKDEIMIQTYIQDVLKEQLNKRQMIDSVSRNVLRFLTAVCGYAEVRLLASQRLEAWLQNPKLTRPAQELLMSVALNCNTHSADDIDVIANLVRMRLKAKPVANQYVNCIKELLSQHTNNLGTTLKHVIYNELSQQRNPHNMAILSVIFTYDPEAAAKYLAIVFQDLLCSREDYLRALRALFREIVRSLKYEVNLVEFCRSMMQERHETVFLELEQTLKDRMFISVIDLICLGCFLSVSPIVKELSLSLAKGEKRDYSVLQAFQSQISVIQTDAIWFFHTKVIAMYTCAEKEFVMGLQRILFLESNEQYSNKDNWPAEAERNVLLQLVREVPLAEDALLRLHLLGLGEDLFINHADTLDVTEKMILRATVLRTGLQGLEIERTEVLHMLLSLSAYSHPKDIQLPVGYTPPALAISLLYWKAWLMMLVLAATNPATLGLSVWETYPTARCMMEMLITGCYQFPPLACGDASPDEIRANELQLARAEKDDIVVFEGHLAAATSGATICENTSLLISQLMNLDPSGPPRQPPSHVIDRLKIFNETYGLGKMLCHSREPDFLLSIIQSQGSNRSMPWLADLVQSSESSLNALPIQCLCEFLLMKQASSDIDLHYSKHRSIKYKVASRLHDLLIGSEATAESSNKLVKYFIQRWSSSELKDREASVNGFKSILLLPRSKRGSTSSACEPIDVDEPCNWLHDKMSNLPFFVDVVSDILIAIRESLTVEVDVQRMREYIQFLSHYYQKESRNFVHVLVENLSQLLTCRRTVSKKMIDTDSPDGLVTYRSLLEIFSTYISSELRSTDMEMTPEDKINKVKVTWSKKSLHPEKYLVVHLKVAHACIVLLTHSSNAQQNENCDFLLRTWFLEKGHYKMIDTCSLTELELYEEWLRVMMIQSSHKQLVKAGLEGCTPTQLIKFLQASGIAAENLSYLLNLLDVCAKEKPDELLNLIFDTDHFIQLVELAQSRGAISGETFCKLLEPDYQKDDESLSLNEIAMDLSVNEVGEEMHKDTPSHASFSEDSLREIFENIFIKDENTNEKKPVNRSFLKLKQKLASCALSKCPHDIEVANTVTNILLDLCAKEPFLNAFTLNSREAINLLQLLSSVPQSEEFKELILMVRDSKTKHKLMENIICSISEKLCLNEPKNTPKKSVKKLLDSFVSSKGSSKDFNNNNLDLFIDQLSEYNIEELDKGKLVQTCLLVSRSSKFNFERLIKSLCTNVKIPGTVKYLVDILVQVIPSVEDQFCGVVIDWLSILDPEMLKVNPTTQKHFLFSHKNPTPTSAGDKSLTAYMTSILAHQTQNSTLEECLGWILDHVKDSESLKATNCLDFLTAMMNNPRLWQGRENRQETEKQELQDAYGNEGHILIDLTVHQIYTLIRLILCELDQQMKVSSDETMEKCISDTMDKRLSLLLNLSSKSSRHLHKAIKLIQQFNKYPQKVLDCFRRHLYSRQPLISPDIMKLSSQSSNDSYIPAEAETPIDKLIHRLILSICEPNGTPSWEEKFKCVSAMNRRLAVNHPNAFLRHLPLLLSMLQGKSRLTSGVFKLTNQLLYCTHVFGLFDILRPHVFSENKQSEITTTLFIEVFMELIQSNCLKPDQCAGFVNKMVEYLNSCIASGTKWIGRVLKKYENTFKELMYDFPNFEGLPFISTFISAYDENSDIQPSLLACHITPFNEVQLSSFKQRLSPNHHSKDLLNVLTDLDDTSKRRIDILKHFLQELSALTVSCDAYVRDKAHTLLLRHYKYQPRDSCELVDLYLDHLNSSSTDVIESTAKYSSQLLLLSDKKCDTLLKRLYHIAMSSHNQISCYIIESLKNLNVDY